MPRRGDELDAEAAQVEHDGAEHVHVRLARVAAPRAHLAELERAAEQAAGRLVQGIGQLERLPGEDEVVAAARGESILRRISDGVLGTGPRAVRAEEATAQVE